MYYVPLGEKLHEFGMTRLSCRRGTARRASTLGAEVRCGTLKVLKFTEFENVNFLQMRILRASENCYQIFRVYEQFHGPIILRHSTKIMKFNKFLTPAMTYTTCMFYCFL